MKKYKITVEIITDVEGKSYPNSEKIYEQVYEASSEIILENIIKSVNEIDVTY